MLLVVDVGNTQTVIGLYADGGSGPRTGELLHHWRIATNLERTSDEHAVLVSQLLDLQGYEPTEVVTGISISSTVPRLTAVMREMAEQWFRVPTVVVEPGVRTGMSILADDPKEVGADRIANAVAAYDLYGGPCIVVDFGTATTVDATSERGEYLGGAIMPGIEVSMAALFERAARLFGVELVEPRNVIGCHRRVVRCRAHTKPQGTGGLDFPPTWNVVDTNEYCWRMSPKLLSKLGVVPLDDWLDAEPCKPHLRQVNCL